MFNRFKTTPDVSELDAACQSFLDAYEKMKRLRERVGQISRQIGPAQQRTVEKRNERDRRRQLYLDSMTDTARLALDEAELALVDGRNEIASLIDAQKALYEQIEKQSEEISKLAISIRDLALKAMKDGWSLRQAWANGMDKEVSWRESVLLALLRQLPSVNQSAIRALHAFFQGDRFQAKVLRGFRVTKMSPVSEVWNDQLERFVPGDPTLDVQLFSKDTLINVPGDLSPKTAYDEVLLGRLEVVGA